MYSLQNIRMIKSKEMQWQGMWHTWGVKKCKQNFCQKIWRENHLRD